MLKFTEDHEWLKLDGDVATVGITEHAADALGDLVFVQLPEVGATLAKGDGAAVVESVKAASDVFAPLAGEVVEVNEAIVNDPVACQPRSTRRWLVFQAEAGECGGFREAVGRSTHTKPLLANLGNHMSAEKYDPYDFANRRHIGPSPEEIAEMLRVVGVSSLEALIDETVPENIRAGKALDFGRPLSERGALDRLRETANKNRVLTSLIGQGYHGTIMPPAIQRNIFENPAWYTAYTPYQPEISQGRLEALLNFQTPSAI